MKTLSYAAEVVIGGIATIGLTLWVLSILIESFLKAKHHSTQAHHFWRETVHGKGPSHK